MRMERLIVGTDFSQPSYEAARWVARHFAPDAELTLAHVVEVPKSVRWPGGRQTPSTELIATLNAGAGKRLQELATALRPARVTWVTAVGIPSVELARIAEERNADVIAVGKRGRRQGFWSRLGSTAEGLVSETAAPVLLAAGMRDEPPRNLLAAVDDDSVKGWVVRWAQTLSSAFDAGCVALTVARGVVRTHLLAMPALASHGGGAAVLRCGDELDGNTDVWVAEFVGPPDFPEASETESMVKDPGPEIVDAAKRLGNDLIVLGSRRRPPLQRTFLGSVARHVVRYARCPVFVAKVPEYEPL